MAVTVVSLSQLSMTMLDARVVTWLKREGEPVKEGEPLLEVETDKANVNTVHLGGVLIGTLPHTRRGRLALRSSSFRRARMANYGKTRIAVGIGGRR